MKSSENFAASLTPFCAPQAISLGVNFIKAWREHAGLTQDKLGEALDPPASAGTISSYETGSRKASQRRLSQIASVLETTPGKLLDEPPPLPGAQVVSMPAELIRLWPHIESLDRAKQALALLRVIAESDEDGTDRGQT